MKRFSPSREHAGCKLALQALVLCFAITTMGRGQQPTTVVTGTATVNTPAVAALGVNDQLDRAIAIVNGDLVLDSDVDKEQRFEALNFDPDLIQDHAAPTTATARDEAIERLINRELILQQIRLQNETPVADDALDHAIEELRQTLPGCSKQQCDTSAGWENYLKAEGFTVASFREYWRERLQVLSFVEERFRSGIRIDPQSVSEFYEQTMLPRYREAKVQPPPLDKVSDRIQAVLVERQVSKLLNDWLQSLRAQGGVVIIHPGQSAP